MVQNAGKLLCKHIVIPLALAAAGIAAKKAVDYAEERSGWDLQSVRDAFDKAFRTGSKGL
ncbi:MAG: hypothetical protein ACYDCF_05400 [Burkholderiales bacterium]